MTETCNHGERLDSTACAVCHPAEPAARKPALVRPSRAPRYDDVFAELASYGCEAPDVRVEFAPFVLAIRGCSGCPWDVGYKAVCDHPKLSATSPDPVGDMPYTATYETSAPTWCPLRSGPTLLRLEGR